jgi:hypothetical protein
LVNNFCLQISKFLRCCSSTFGYLSFGALDKRSITQQKWDWIRYRIAKSLLDNTSAPQHMVLNQYNVITSGDLTKDTSLENLVIETLDSKQLSLLPIHIYAQDIYKVVDGNTILTRESWIFDSVTQLLVLNQNVSFSSEHALVTVVFIPGKPVTNTYLEQQSLMDSVTRLNEGTPPIPMSYVSLPTKQIITDSFDGESYNILIHESDPASLYEADQLPVPPHKSSMILLMLLL